MTDRRGRGPSPLRSLRVQGVALLAILLVLPVLLYSLLADFQSHRRDLLLTAVRDAGAAIASGLAPDLTDMPAGKFGDMTARLERFADPRRTIVLLFHPWTGAASQEFYFIASAPTVDAAGVAAARDRLVGLGILPALSRSCTGGTPLAERVAPDDGQAPAVITSITAVSGSAGCWAVVIEVDSETLLAGIDDRPFWRHSEVQVAFGVYAAMAILILLVFASVRANLDRFRDLALAPAPTRGFVDVTDVPEMAPVAQAIDGMVQRLRGAADVMRQAAEDNAHAFKGPIATIRHAVEPLLGANPPGERLQPALGAVAAALDRLDGLVRSARRLDAAAADLLVMADAPVDLAPLLAGLVAGFRAMDAGSAVVIEADLAPSAVVRGETDGIETIFENLIDNAIGFSPTGGLVLVTLTLRDGRAVVTVEDSGPGVPEARLTGIFDRYHTDRSAAPDRAVPDRAHFGIGLWLARQNVRALGGEISAGNRPEGGLRVRVSLKLAARETARATAPPARAAPRR